YSVLNNTNPNLTEYCWLCYGIRPPFYEAVGIATPIQYTNDTNPAQCKWKTERQGITLTHVTGRGVCVGNVPEAKRKLCINDGRGTDELRRPAKWLLPAENTKWVCSTIRVTPCLALGHFDETLEYCVQVAVVPKIFYHPGEFVYDMKISLDHHLFKREPFTAPTIAMLMALGGTGVATGVASLVQQSKEFRALRAAVDEDLARTEQLISALEKSVRSLSEVVLQNHRGLDLMYLQRRGVCAALGEECCVYADHTGVARDSITKLRGGLEERKRDREAQQGWFESWFNHSPWLTTLISTLIGPIVMIMMALTFGPCILNRLMSFIKSWLENVNIMLVESHQ
ncbi:hypothetical protein N307_08190, partial [Dryobates pubescens]